MRRCLFRVVCLGFGIIFGTAGCFSESAPPLAAINVPREERSQQFEGVPSPAEGNGTPSVEKVPQTSAVPDAPDEAIRAVIRGLEQGQPDALWDALPGSYQRDLNDLVRMAARRLNPEAWRWFLQIAGKGANAVRLKYKNTAVETSASVSPEDPAEKARPFETLATFLELLSKSGPHFLDRLKSADLGDLLRTEGRTAAPIVCDMAERLFGLWQTLRTMLPVSVTVKESDGDSAVLGVAYLESGGTEIDCVCVEGKWIPRWLAEQWAGTIGIATKAVLEVLPSETASDNFGRTFQALAAVDCCLDAWLWQAEHPGIDSDSLFDDFPGSIYDSLMMLGYLIRGTPTDESDFHKQTKQESLSADGKVTLVYCYASKELKWDNETVDFDLAKHVAYQLNDKKIKVVDPDRVYAWLDKNSRWKKPSEIGATFKVDYIVHIDLIDYRLLEANSANLLRGHADCVVNVIKMNSDGQDGRVIYTHPIKSNFPKRGPLDLDSMPWAEFRKRYLTFLSNEIGELFYSSGADADRP